MGNKFSYYKQVSFFKNKAFVDLLLLTFVALFLQGRFIPNLGFYSDDWAFLSILGNTEDKSIVGLTYNFFVRDEVIRMRPFQAFEIAVLYWLFDTNPIGYHAFNSVIFLLVIVLFYLTLKKLDLPYIVVICIPLIYALLPHYSTARIWMSTFCTNFSILFFFFNFYANLTLLYIKDKRRWSEPWLRISLASLLISILSYEVVLPLFLVNFLIVWWKDRELNNSYTSSSEIRKLLLLNGLLLGACIIFKALISIRTGGFGDRYISHIIEILTRAVSNDFITYGIRLPQIIWRIFRLYSDYRLFLTAFFFALATCAYLMQVKQSIYKFRDWLVVVLAGLVVYLAGYAIFLTTAQIQITPTGISNRVTMAASLGVATILFGMIGLVCYFIRLVWLRKLFFSICISLLCSFGYVINCTIASFYCQSYFIQLKILDDLYKNISIITTDNVLLLDGICPYIGPAPIFECYWDIGGALQLHYHNTSIKGDVCRDRLTYNKKGITTTIYGEEQFYPFSKNLIVYNNQSKKHYILRTFRDAKVYFTSLRAADRSKCAAGSEGYGATIF